MASLNPTGGVSTFRLPELHLQFPLAYHKNGDAIAAASDEWFATRSHNFTEDKRRRLNGLKAGQLTAYIYNQTNDDRLRVACDFMVFVFHLDDLSDKLGTKDTVILADIVMNAFASPHTYRPTLPDGRELPEDEPDASRLARDYWGRCVREAAPAVQARYCANMDLFFKSVQSEVKSRETGSLFDVESYISHRRDNSGCQPGFDLLEYTLGIELPEPVIKDPIFQAIKNCANDFISLSNDIFSYNVEQSRGDTYNIVVIIMKTYGLDLQGAVDRVAEMCRESLDNYFENKAKLPSWSPQTDHNVADYIQGIEDWISATYHWTFITERYFGSKNDEVRRTGVVELLLPKYVRPNAA